MGNMNWRKSSYSSGNGGECIEVASPDDTVAVRDTKQKGSGPVLRFSSAAWRRFADQVKRSLASDPNLGSTDASGGTLLLRVPHDASRMSEPVRHLDREPMLRAG
jgi:hypothetical protein